MESGIAKFVLETVGLVKNPEVIALALAIPVLFRIIAGVLFLIGKIIPGDDFSTDAANWFKRMASHTITALKWIGIGYTNKTKKRSKK